MLTSRLAYKNTSSFTALLLFSSCFIIFTHQKTVRWLIESFLLVSGCLTVFFLLVLSQLASFVSPTAPSLTVSKYCCHGDVRTDIKPVPTRFTGTMFEVKHSYPQGKRCGTNYIYFSLFWIIPFISRTHQRCATVAIPPVMASVFFSFFFSSLFFL